MTCGLHIVTDELEMSWDKVHCRVCGGGRNELRYVHCHVCGGVCQGIPPSPASYWCHRHGHRKRGRSTYNHINTHHFNDNLLYSTCWQNTSKRNCVRKLKFQKKTDTMYIYTSFKCIVLLLIINMNNYG